MHYKTQIQTLEDKLSFIYVSDLHLEVDKENPDVCNFINEKVSDIIILAGDIHKGTSAINIINHLLSLNYVVIYVLGNHEFWDNDIDTLINEWRELSSNTDNLYFLENDTVTINDVDFIGSCLFTSLGTRDISEQIDWFLKQSLKETNDFERIKNIKPDVMRHLFFQSKNYIFDQLDDNRKQIVVTHYAPCELSSLEIYKNDPIRTLFFSEMGNDIAYSNIKYWIHGHMHNSSDYMINQTNILCNPRGYPFSKAMLNDDFSWTSLKRYV